MTLSCGVAGLLESEGPRTRLTVSMAATGRIGGSASNVRRWAGGADFSMIQTLSEWP